MPRSGIREIFDLANTLGDVIHLEMGEPDFETPPHVREAAARAAEDGYTKYTPNAGIPELREAIAVKVRKRNGFDATPEQVIVTPGAIAAIFGTFLALCDPGDEILVSDPAWPNYRMVADLQGLTVRRYPLSAERGMEPDLDALESLVGERTKALLLNSPSNPTGAVWSAETLAELSSIADRHDLWVVSDEVYDEMTFEEPAVAAATVFDPDRVVSVYSFSKTYAMTGWRLGYAVAPPSLAPFVVKTQEPTTACVNAPAQMAGLAALTGPQDRVVEMRNAYRMRRDRVLEILAERDVVSRKPGGAFYLWIDVRDTGMPDLEFARSLLERRHVAVTPGSAFGERGVGFVRVSLATATAALFEGAARMADTVAGLRSAIH
jgi:aspartate/methionine/tyrosine aminotransferase